MVWFFTYKCSEKALKHRRIKKHKNMFCRKIKKNLKHASASTCTVYDCTVARQRPTQSCGALTGPAIDEFSWYAFTRCTFISRLLSEISCHRSCYSAPSPPRRGAEYCDERVCLSFRDHIFRTTHPIFTKVLCMLPMAVARSSPGGVVIRYLLPVLWMTSYLLISQV